MKIFEPKTQQFLRRHLETHFPPKTTTTNVGTWLPLLSSFLDPQI